MVKSERSDDVIICSFDQSNKLNAVNSEEVRTEIGKYFDTAGTKLILDLGNIEFIDSSGFGVLLSVMKKAKNNSGDLRICCIKPEVMSLFKLLQLHNVFHLCNTIEDCRNSF